MLYVGGKGDVQTENKILIELLYLISLASLLTHKDIRVKNSSYSQQIEIF